VPLVADGVVEVVVVAVVLVDVSVVHVDVVLMIVSAIAMTAAEGSMCPLCRRWRSR
jgi:hypothetical protein